MNLIGGEVHKRLFTMALLMGAVLMVFAACGGSSEETAPAAAERASPPIPPAAPAVSSESPASGGPSVPVAGGTAVSVSLNDSGGRGPFEFAPIDFTFKRGETVNFSFVGESQFHTFTINELGIDVAVDGGASVDFSFTFDTPGTYKLICIPHEALGMVGTITIEDAPAPSSAPAPAAPAPSAAATDVATDLNDAGGRGPFEFAPTDYEFSVGETVNFSFTSESQFHTFTVNDLGIDVAVDGGATVNFSHTFDTPGTYELICIPHEALGMVGTITVR
ncbi:MAG: hypothetical protein IIB17_02075 [Chloroflexi bacterium]|nr:hypothetical protein [Chloroflexota bacterium]